MYPKSSVVTMCDHCASMATTTTWQAIFSPQYNRYYFYNPLTEETTWTNPLQQEPQPESSTGVSTESDSVQKVQEEEQATDKQLTFTTTSAVSARHAALQAAALAQGIDPLLAHLDPSLLASPSMPGTSGGGTNGMLYPFYLPLNASLMFSFIFSFYFLIKDLPSFTAKFNARTGQFTPASARTPGHLSEHERAKRMSEFYFDVGKWEEDLARRGGRLMVEEEDAGGEYEEGTKEKKRKRPSKKELVCASFFYYF